MARSYIIDVAILPNNHYYPSLPLANNHSFFMYSKIFILVLFSMLFALAAVAAPQPEGQLEERDFNLSSVVAHASSKVMSLASVGSEIKGVFKTVESIGGEVFTVITSKGGKAFTLATSGAGVETSMLGAIYTVATAKSSSSGESSSAFVPHAGVQTSLLVALGSVLVGTLLGMTMVL